MYKVIQHLQECEIIAECRIAEWNNQTGSCELREYPGIIITNQTGVTMHTKPLAPSSSQPDISAL